MAAKKIRAKGTAKKQIKRKGPSKKTVNKMAVNAIVAQVSAEPSASSPEIKKGKYSVTNVVSRSFKYANKYMADFTLYYILPFCIAMAMYVPFYISAFKNASAGSAVPEMTGILGMTLAFPLMLLSGFGLVMALVKVDKSERNELAPGGQFKFLAIEALKRVPMLLVIYVVMMLAAFTLMIPMFITMFVGALAKKPLLMLPGFLIYMVGFTWLVVVYGQSFIIVITKSGIFNVFKMSADLTRGRRVDIVMTYLLLMVMIIAAELVMLGAGAFAVMFFKENIPLMVVLLIPALVILTYLLTFMMTFYYAQYKELEETQA